MSTDEIDTKSNEAPFEESKSDKADRADAKAIKLELD